MPLVHSEKINDTNILLVWHLTESESELASLAHPIRNIEELATVSHPQKKREWFASRLLLRLLAEEVGVPFSGTYKDDHGKVFLSDNEAHISITHTFGYVAAVINTGTPVGIDMEKLDPKLQRTARKFLNLQEQAHADDDLPLLAMYWCAKEAVYKLHGKTKISFKDHIHIEAFEAGQIILQGSLQTEFHPVKSKIHIRWFEDYCLAVAV